MTDATPLIFPAFGAWYAALAPWLEALLRVGVGLALIPHGLRAFFGFFPNSGARVLSFRALAAQLERSGYRPGAFWAGVTAVTEFVAGPLLAVGLFTRLAAVPVFIFLLLSAVDHARFDGWFWNKLGLEYPAIWALAALIFVAIGGGPISLDHLVIGREF